MIKKYKNLSVQARAAIWYTICNLLQKGILIIAVPIYTRILTTEQYGSYSVFLSWLEIFEIVATFRLSWEGYMVGLTKYSDDRDRYTSSIQGLGFTITSIALIIYLAIPDLINSYNWHAFWAYVNDFCFAVYYAYQFISGLDVKE